VSVTCGRSLFSTNKTDRHGITDILLKETLNTINLSQTHYLGDIVTTLLQLNSNPQRVIPGRVSSVFLNCENNDTLEDMYTHTPKTAHNQYGNIGYSYYSMNLSLHFLIISQYLLRKQTYIRDKCSRIHICNGRPY
jgi:hypothetical protein